VTLTVPLAALNQLPEARCDWLVPGLLEEKITALIKSLPQSVRRAYVPVPEYARAAAQALGEEEWGKGNGKRQTLPLQFPVTHPPFLTTALGDFLERAAGTAVPRDAWRPEALPAHLAMNYRVMSEDGRVLAQGRDLAALRRQFGAEAQRELGRSATALEREGITAWDFDALPERVEVGAGKQRLTAFPALAANPEGSVSLKLFDSRPTARDAHWRGVCRMVWLAHSALLRQTERDLAASLKPACLQYQLMDKTAGCTGLVRDILLAACLDACPTDPAEVRTAAAFTDLAARVRPRLPEAVHRTAGLAADCLSRAHTLQQTLAKAPAAWGEAVLDMQTQLGALVHPGFVADTPPAWLQRIPHYLRAISLRLEKLPKAQARDTQAMREFAPLSMAWTQRRSHQAGPDRDPALEDFRWRLEELRVALFAQEVKTLEPTSVKRLEKRWAEIAGP
jgi:ATP-dependent helicase HrpA